MSVANSTEALNRIADVIGSVRSKGVRLWSENGQLRYKAPRDALTAGEIETLRASRSQVIAFLESAAALENKDRSACTTSARDRAPLTFSQLQHWRSFRLAERRTMRHIAAAVRLTGPLNIAALERSLSEVVRRHDALRTRIVFNDGTPMQEVLGFGNSSLAIDDLTQLSNADQEAEVNRRIEELVFEPIDVTVGPLFATRLLRLGDRDHVLIVAMEHLISDAFSRGLLLREVFMAYGQTVTDRPFSLPPVPVQLADYAVWQRSAHRSWLESHGAQWIERLAACEPLRFPDEDSPKLTGGRGWGSLPISIGGELKSALREWSRSRRTTLAMSVFTAYVALAFRWCNASQLVIRYQSDGRVRPEIETTIGYFATELYLKVELHEQDSLIDLMNRVTQEYCLAYQCSDFSYAAAQASRPELTRAIWFNWVPESSKIGATGSNGPEHTIEVTSLPIRQMLLRRDAATIPSSVEGTNDPALLLYDFEQGIIGELNFPLDRFSAATMERFSRQLLVVIGELLRNPQIRVADMVLR